MTAEELIDVVVPVRNEFEKLKLCCQALRSNVPINNLIIPTANISEESMKTVETLADIPLFDRGLVGAGATRRLGISAVETEYYGSIDADVVISKEWYQWCIGTISQPRVAACQGYQKPLGKFADKWLGPLYKSGWHCDQGNTMLRTQVIRDAGIPVEIQSEDALLRSRLQERGYQWIVNPDLISVHMQTDIDFLRHWYWYGRLDPHDWRRVSKYMLWLPKWTVLENPGVPIDLALFKFLSYLSREVGSLVGQYS